ncbi:MAG TPA: glycosyltransferase family 1 protein [Chloroflexota bacterium]|jgi:glycosyltransferase involved in cell wall biosynthesis|nr:glycosyltransferase family 1 protein [Chloroflexota bacterium]
MARIGINASLLTFAQTYRNAGSSAYIYQLLQQLPALGSNHQFVVFTNANRDELIAARTSSFKLIGSRLDTERPIHRILWEQTALPVQLARWRVDLIHGTLNVLPLARRVPGIVTIHDVAFLRFPERYLPAKRRYLTHLTRWSARGAHRVIASSENTRRDLVRLLGVREDRVHVIYLGVEDRMRQPVDPAAVARLREQHELPPQFFLYIGTLEPRKNLVRLLGAYQRARKAGVEWPLVLAGAKGWLYEEIFAQVRALNLEEYVRFPGYVLYDDLPLWYNAAGAFVYPSLYEGFGLPIAEAMACGCPVLTARNSSLPEVAGDAAILVDGEDVEALSQGLMQLAGDGTVRASLAVRGRRQAERFTWQRTAAEVMGVYDEVLREA